MHALSTILILHCQKYIMQHANLYWKWTDADYLPDSSYPLPKIQLYLHIGNLNTPNLFILPITGEKFNMSEIMKL